MQLFAGLIKVRFFLFLFLSLGMVGCADWRQTERSPKTTVSKAALVQKDAAGRYYQDAVAKFAIGNVPQSAGLVQMNSQTRYQVRVGSDYVAVTGEACRYIIIVQSSGAATNTSVCRIKGIWKAINLP